LAEQSASDRSTVQQGRGLTCAFDCVCAHGVCDSLAGASMAAWVCARCDRGSRVDRDREKKPARLRFDSSICLQMCFGVFPKNNFFEPPMNSFSELVSILPKKNIVALPPHTPRQCRVPKKFLFFPPLATPLIRSSKKQVSRERSHNLHSAVLDISFEYLGCNVVVNALCHR